MRTARTHSTGSAGPARQAIHVAHVVGSLETGGLERLVQWLTPLFQRDGFRISVVRTETRSQAKPQKSLIQADLEARGVEVHWLPTPVRQLPLYALRLARLIRRKRFDVVHCHVPLLGAVSGIVSGCVGCRCVVTMHSDATHSWVGPIRGKLLDQLSIRLGEHRVGVSPAVRDRYTRLYRLPPRKVTFIPNGVPTERFDAAAALDSAGVRDELGLARGRIVVMNVGSARKVKDLPTLARAAAILERSQPGRFQFVQVGRGAHNQPLVELVDELGLGEAFVFLGERDDVPQVLRAADLYASSSLVEGFGISILEAMVSKVPVITTDLRAVVDTFGREQFAGIVPVRSPAGLACAIMAAADDPDRRLRVAEAAWRMARDRFSLENCARMYEILYRARRGELPDPKEMQ